MVTAATAGEFEQVLLTLAAATDVVVDPRELIFVDSSGLGIFVAAYQEGREHGSTVRLDPIPSFLARVLKVTGLGSLLPAPRRVT